MTNTSLPTPHFFGSESNLTWPEHPAAWWETADDVWCMDLSAAFEIWAGLQGDGSGSVFIGEEIGRFLVSFLEHSDDPRTRFSAIAHDLGNGNAYAELVYKLADSAGLVDVMHSIYFSDLSELGYKWADLFVKDKAAAEAAGKLTHA